MDNLPAWRGASAVYSRCMTINSALCAASYAAAKRKRAWRPPDDVSAAIEAMNRGCEETLKAWTYRHRNLWAQRAEPQGN